jgi:repressor of nif and glnA expression
MVVMVRAHITLKPDYLESREATERVCDQLVRAGLQNISRVLLDDYGILSADVDEDSLVRIGRLEGVAAVEEDRQNRPMTARAGGD